MRVLVVTSPGDGHVLPVVSLAWALRGAGHQVLVATSGTGLDAAARAGLAAVDIAEGIDLAAVRGKHLAGMGRLDQRERFAAAMALFAAISSLMVDGAVAVAEDWRPELVVYTPLQAAGPIAAARCDAQLIEHGFQLTGVLRTIDLLLPHMSEALHRHGLSATDLPPARGLDVCPPGLRSYEPAGDELGYRPYNGGAILPRTLTRTGRRRRICLTLGTSLPAEVGQRLLDSLVGAAGRLGLDVLLAMGDAVAPPAGADHVIASGWLPLASVLPDCDLLVHHGGAGTTLTAAWTSTPQIVLPQLADQHFNAAQVQRAGLGLGVDGSSVTVSGAEQLLADTLESVDRAKCAEIAEQMRLMPDPAEIVAGLRATAGAR